MRLAIQIAIQSFRRAGPFLIALACLCGAWSCRDPVYCPVTSIQTRGLLCDAYLHLGDDGVGDYLEIRRTNHQDWFFVRRTHTLFRAYGAQSVAMKLEVDGVRFTLFADTAMISPDTSIVLAVDTMPRYFELRLNHPQH
jgi:hypothetical protein